MTNHLQEIRWLRNLSQEQVAMKTGLSRTTISSLETGEVKEPKVSTAIKIAKALDVSIEDIFID